MPSLRRRSANACEACDTPSRTSKACEVQASVGSNPTVTASETAPELRKRRAGAVLFRPSARSACPRNATRKATPRVGEHLDMPPTCGSVSTSRAFEACDTRASASMERRLLLWPMRRSHPGTLGSTSCPSACWDPQAACTAAVVAASLRVCPSPLVGLLLASAIRYYVLQH